MSTNWCPTTEPECPYFSWEACSCWKLAFGSQPAPAEPWSARRTRGAFPPVSLRGRECRDLARIDVDGKEDRTATVALCRLAPDGLRYLALNDPANRVNLGSRVSAECVCVVSGQRKKRDVD